MNIDTKKGKLQKYKAPTFSFFIMSRAAIHTHSR